jgi:hypothetical protein
MATWWSSSYEESMIRGNIEFRHQCGGVTLNAEIGDAQDRVQICYVIYNYVELDLGFKLTFRNVT